MLAVALVVAIGAITAVGGFTDRMERGMARGASELVGADLVLLSSEPIDAAHLRDAEASGLAHARTTTFRSVVLAGEQLQLASVKAVGGGYPLKGELRIADAPFEPGRATDAIPAPGTVWVDARLAGILSVGVGDTLELGRTRPRIAQILAFEPDRGGDLFNIAPRLMLHEDDLPATGLLVAGSRARYRLLVAGPERPIAAYRERVAAAGDAGVSLQGVRESRPALRSALDRAGQFLGLAALVSVLLSGAAIAVAARRYVERHLDTAAVMKCLGAPRAVVVRVHAAQLVAIGVTASAVGCALGYLAQEALAGLVGRLLLAELPPPSLLPLGAGIAVGLVVVAGFALPPIVRLANVPPARVLRRDLGPPGSGSALAYGASIAAFSALVAWHVREPVLVGWALAGTALAVLALGVAALALVRSLAPLRRSVGVSWRFGLANIARRPASSTLQIVAFGLGITMLLLLTFVRGDLLSDWRRTLPPGTPNYFLVNVQPDEVEPLSAFLGERGVEPTGLYPMVRARLTAIDGRPVTASSFADPRAERLATREFNLSWTEALQPDNRVVAGRWWRPDEAGEALISVEQDFARTLGFELGTTLTFSIAGRELVARVHNLREVQWDSFNVNFFVQFPPQVLDTFPSTWITSFHLGRDDAPLLTRLVRAFPSITVIDVDAMLLKVREIMDQASVGVEFVFAFTLAAGLVVLHAAVQATMDERRREAALVRTLGADRSRVIRGLLAEFTALGLLCGIVGALAASALGAVLAERVFNLVYTPDPLLWLAGVGGGALAIGAAGYLGSRSVLDQPPMATLREG